MLHPTLLLTLYLAVKTRGVTQLPGAPVTFLGQGPSRLI